MTKRLGRIVVIAFAVDHEPVDPAVGYRFEYGGRSLVISGDTSRSDAVLRASQGVDLLAHEYNPVSAPRRGTGMRFEVGRRRRLTRLAARSGHGVKTKAAVYERAEGDLVAIR